MWVSEHNVIHKSLYLNHINDIFLLRFLTVPGNNPEEMSVWLLDAAVCNI